MSETAGLWMLLCTAVLLLITGLPAWIVLLGVTIAFAAAGLWAGALSWPILTALPPRLIGLLEQDLLQALPLYVLMGALLNRLPLARILFGAGSSVMRGTRSAPQLMSLVLGLLLAPINGSVGASVSMLSRTVRAPLEAAGVPARRSAALICIASTFGVVIPPSLVLILLGDAMLRAHSEALNALRQPALAVNTQDVFRAALLPALLLFVLCMLVAWWSGRRADGPAAMPRPTRSDWLVAGSTFLFLLALLAGVALGYFYAVEGAAAGGAALLLFGLGSRTLTGRVFRDVLRDTMALSGALFAVLIAATMFTLVLRIFGTDRWVASFISGLSGGAYSVLAVVLLILALSALVLDAFEIIFVVIPIVMPPLLMRVPDAVWVSVIVLLVLQASFLVPPLGYAVLLIRGEIKISMQHLMRAILPYAAMQVIVLALVLAFPAITHMLVPVREAVATPAPDESNEDSWHLLQQQRDEEKAR